jgi:hypothetical protein
MQADFSVELGAEDEHLEIPWSSPEGGLRYYDLKRRPELLLNIADARHYAELGEFLSAVNSPACMLETAKCDVWRTDQLMPEEEIYGAPWKFASYVDLLFTDAKARLSFDAYENYARRLVRLLHKAPEISAAAEFIIRLCYYHPQPAAPADETAAREEMTAEGFYLTFYLSGFGDDEDDARRRWGIALKLAENAILQLSAVHRRGADQTAPPEVR